MKRTLSYTIVGLGLIAASHAHAQPGGDGQVAVGLEVGPNFVAEDLPVGAENVGVGFSGRLGYQMGSVIKVTPELKLGFESPGAPDAFRIMGGLRLGLGVGLFTPVAFAHLGGLAGDQISGFTWDVGGGADIELGPVALGAFVSYNRAEDQQLTFAALTDDASAYEWVQVGASVTLRF